MELAISEEIGLFERGKAYLAMRKGETKIDGRLPINTHGGQIGEAYLHGLNGVAEGARLVRGTSCNQPLRPVQNVVVTSAAGVPSSALILSRDH